MLQQRQIKLWINKCNLVPTSIIIKFYIKFPKSGVAWQSLPIIYSWDILLISIETQNSTCLWLWFPSNLLDRAYFRPLLRAIIARNWVPQIFSLTHFSIQKKYKYSGFCRNILLFKRSGLFCLHLKRSFLFTQAFSIERTFFFFSIDYDFIETQIRIFL